VVDGVARIRWLQAVILRSSLRYYYPGVDPGEPPSDYVFDALEHELYVLLLEHPRFRRPPIADRGARAFMEWLGANPEKRLAPFDAAEIIPDERYTNNFCG
jgi:hypothetical protein